MACKKKNGFRLHGGWKGHGVQGGGGYGKGRCDRRELGFKKKTYLKEEDWGEQKGGDGGKSAKEKVMGNRLGGGSERVGPSEERSRRESTSGCWKEHKRTLVYGGGGTSGRSKLTSSNF